MFFAKIAVCPWKLLLSAVLSPFKGRKIPGYKYHHPAVGNSAVDLQRIRAHVIADEEPWASYYKEFSKSEYASKDYKIRNDANPESEILTPKKGYADYQTNLFNGDMVYDAKAAYYRAVMYYMTGDATYREKAMRILRLWSSLNPAEAFYANDAHIQSIPAGYENEIQERLIYVYPGMELSSKNAVQGDGYTYMVQRNHAHSRFGMQRPICRRLKGGAIEFPVS